MDKIHQYDVVIIGAGMVGLAVGKQLKEKEKTLKVLIIDKEENAGQHCSGRNSGILHAGIYYKPNTLKAEVCIKGSKELKDWVRKNSLDMNECGKIIICQDEELDAQLDILYERGRANGAAVEFVDRQMIKRLEPQACLAGRRALWSPHTSVVNPKQVVNKLKDELIENDVDFLFSEDSLQFQVDKSTVILKNNERIKYKHLFNCAGIQADKISHEFGIGKTYRMMPFKGIYWKVRSRSELRIRRNIYPVPDLGMPFLGVHFSPDAKGECISIGPTALLAPGRESYRGIERLETVEVVKNILEITKQCIRGKKEFRRYVSEQLLLNFKPNVVREATKLVPALTSEDLELSEKVGIRPQLINIGTGKLEDDFIALNGASSTHVLNAISPAFTASFVLARKIIEISGYI